MHIVVFKILCDHVYVWYSNIVPENIIQFDIHYLLSGWESRSSIFDPRVLSLSKILFSRRLADGDGWKDVSFHFKNAFRISRGSTKEIMIYRGNWKIILMDAET